MTNLAENTAQYPRLTLVIAFLAFLASSATAIVRYMQFSKGDASVYYSYRRERIKLSAGRRAAAIRSLLKANRVPDSTFTLSLVNQGAAPDQVVPEA